MCLFMVLVIPRDYNLVSFHLTGLKCPEKSNLTEEGSILAHHSRFQSTIMGKPQAKELEGLVILYLKSRNMEKQMNTTQLPSSTMQFRIPNRGWPYPQRLVLFTSIKSQDNALEACSKSSSLSDYRFCKVDNTNNHSVFNKYARGVQANIQRKIPIMFTLYLSKE